MSRDKRQIRVQWNYGTVAIVLLIAAGFAISGPWWGVLLVLSFFPLAWLRARLMGEILTQQYLGAESETERLARQLAGVRLAMETLRQQNVHAWAEVDRLRELLDEAEPPS